MKKLVKLVAIGAAAAVAATLGAIAPASAHGEKSQQAFLRMRTLNWYDVAWSKTTVNVNEEMILSGKVHVFSAWPQAVAKSTRIVFERGRARSSIGPHGSVYWRAVCATFGFS